MVDSRDLRLVYAKAKEKLAKEGIDVDKAILSQSYLQLEANLTMGGTSFVFPVLNSETNPYNPQAAPTEVRLQQQDVYIMSHILFGLRWQYKADGVTANNWRYLIERYPTEHDDAIPAAINKDNLLRLWMSRITFEVNGKVYIPNWDTERHLKIPQTQYPAVINPPVVNPEFTNVWDQLDGSEDGYYPVQPTLMMWGNANNQWTITLPEAIPAGTWTGEAPRLVLKFRGILAQNCTKIA